MTAIDRLIQVAEGEIGYLEKKSNRDLDDKNANAGSNNYTKYNRDMRAWAGSAGIDDQWCQNFVDWCFCTAYGLDIAKRLLGVFTNYTPTGSNAFKQRGTYFKRGTGTPKRGDVVYFYSSAKKRIGHVGIVWKVSGSTVYTIEGNTSGASTLVTNGGGVKKKSYSLSSTYIDGYGRPDYTILDGMTFDGAAWTTPVLGDRVLSNYCEGDDVKELQKALISLCISCGPDGADGEYGDNTEMAVREFQQINGVPVTGKYDAATHEAMTVALKLLNHPAENPRYVMVESGYRCYVRPAPNTDNEPLGVLIGGRKIPYGGEQSQSGWLLVEWEGKNAWVSGKYGKLVD